MEQTFDGEATKVWLLRNVIIFLYITRLPNRGLWKGEVEWVGQLAFSVTLLSDFRASALAHWSSRSLRLRVIKILAVVFTLYPPKIPKTKVWRTAKKKGVLVPLDFLGWPHNNLTLYLNAREYERWFIKILEVVFMLYPPEVNETNVWWRDDNKCDFYETLLLFLI